MKQSVIDYGDCCIGYCYSKNIELENLSDFPARFQVLAQPDEAKTSFAYHVDSCGSANDDVTTIPARTVQLIKLNVEVRRMGHADFPVFIQLVGKEEMPLVLDVSARGVGPKVHLSASSLDWGKIPVLESKTMTLTLRNDSRIPTAFECALPRDGSVFKVVPMIGTIPPGETIAVQVTALLDDTVIFSELLKVTVHMGSVYDVALHAKGLGSTIRIKESIEDVDFSSVFSNQACRRRVTVVNHGRRMQTLVWTHGGEKRISSKQQPEVTYFRVQPARLTLYPGEEQVVEIIGLSDIAQRVSETISCFGYYEKNPTKYLILKAELAANFIDPVVSFTPSTLHFLCDTYRQTNAPVSVESVQITNVTGLPLNMCLQTTSPFAVDNAQSSYELAPGETMSAHVSFGRGVVQPKCAVTEQGRLAISFRDHRQKSFVDLVGKYTFPSVIVDKTAVDFGYCLPYTEQHRVVTIRNPGDKSLNYHWSFSLDGHDATDTETVAQSFDIHPIRGTIAPGATEAATVIFYGGSFGATRITAVCSVENGPEYGIQVRGNCSPMEFHVDKSLIDFGSRPFAEINLQDFNIVNDSDVAVDFDIRLPPGSTLANRVSIVPREGRIAARDKQGVTINFCAGVPEMIDAQFFVHVAHLEPRAVRVTAKGTAPRCRVDLPKILTAEQSEMVSEQENVVRELNVLLPAMHPVNIPGWKPINVDDILDEHLAVDVSQHEHQHMIRANERVLKRLSDDLTRRSRISSHTPQLNNFLGSPILHHKTFQLLGGIKKTVQNFVELNKTVAEKYRCDFGYVVRNAVQKLTFSVFNTGANPMTIFVDKSALQGTGFEVAVDKIRNLAPQESQQLEVTFNSRAITDGGLAAAELRLEAFNGFAYVVELRAQVVVPDVVLSADSLDFGNVHLGQRRVMHLRLVNPHPVPCDWSIGKAAPAAMDKAPKQNARQAAAAAILLAEQHMGTVFTVSSLSGKLAIGEKFDICVTFTPEADMEYALVLPVHISTNKRALSVSVRGRGASLKLAIEPHSLNFGTVAPFDGVERKFTISNHSELPLEVFSADLDGQFLEEELVLNVWNQYIQGRTYILPRGIGHGLPQEFVEYAARKNESLMGATVSPAIKALTDDATTLPVSVPLLGLDAPTNLQTNPHQMEPSSLVANQLRDNNMDESHDAHATTVSSADALYIVLHGAPFAGKSSHAKRLSAAYGIPILRLDDMFDALRKSSIPGGSNFAHGVHRKSMTKLSAAEVNNVVDAKRPGVFPGGEKQRGGNGSFSSDFVDGAQAFGEENLFEKLRAVLSGASYSRGFIVDGIESRYFPHTGMLAKFLCEFVGPTACVHFFLLTVEPQIMREREAAHEAARKMKERAVRNCIREIDEDLYDALPSVALERYERVLNVMKTQRKQFLQHFGQKRRDGAASAKSDANKSAADDEKSKKKDKIRRRNKSVMKSAGGGGGSSVDPKESGANGKASAIGKKDRNVLSIDEEVSTVASGQKGGVVTIPFGNGSPDSPEFEEMQVVLGENLLTMYESYVETLESFVSVIRDVDKVSSHTLRTIAAKLAPQDPKKQAKSKANAAASAITAIPASVSVAAADLPNGSNKQLVESDLIIADNAAAIKFREIATIQQTIDTVYDELRAMLPRVRDQKTASDNADSDAIPVAFTQEIVLAPVPVNAHTREEIKALFAVAHAKLDIASGAIDEGEPRVAGGTPSLHSALRHSEQSAVCRWVVQPGTTKDLTIRFSPVRVGTWNHTLRFGVLGYAGLKSIDCQAACCYPSIGLHPEERTTRSRSTRKSTRQTPAVEVVPTRTYDFGPLLCGKLKDKSVEKQMENRENRATFTITNMSTIADIKVFFFLKTDPRGEIFSIDPPNLDLDAGQTSTLTVFAYPKTPGQFEETIICCIKDNPEPLVLRVTCAGAKPELELDKKIVQFEKLLLGRSDSRDLKITNLSALNVAWKLVGMETLVEDFDIKPVEGIIGPNAIETVKIGFQSCKPGSIKRSLKLEVSDPERVTGIAQTENISIVAESYDVTVDVHFPRSIENGIDFGVCRVDEESKHSCLLRNKGKYEIGFKFETDWKELASCLTVSPSHGTVAASDKPVTVQLLFKSGQETLIRDNTSLKCSIIEPATGEVIGIVPVKLSAKAVYSKHVITPVRELAFGASVLGTKTTRTFTIENTGEFDFKFAISTADRQSAAREASLRGKADQSKHHLKKEVVKQQVDNLTVGPFVVFPANGVVQIGGKQQLVVEFQAETADSFEELIEVDISDRSSDLKGGAIEYRLLGETCVPGIQNQDFMSIFEEHTVVKKLDQFINTNNVFAEDDRCFSFGPLLVATSSQARLKLRNPFKVPCEVTLSLKMRARLQSAASGGGGTGGSVVSGDTRVVSKQDGNDILAFEIEPKFLKLAPHESQFVVVSFHPQALVHYSAHLEAAVENTASEHEFKTLGVELRGEGTLPHVTVESPVLRGKGGTSLLKFRRTICGQSMNMPVVLKNDGIIPAKLKFEWTGTDVGTVFLSPELDAIHTILPGENATINIAFAPRAVRKYECDVKLRVLDNVFEDAMIQFIGEGFNEEFSFNNLPLDSENEIRFGPCRVGEVRTVNFLTANHSSETMRFSWQSSSNEFVISPSLMHVRPHETKEVTVSVCPRAPSDAITAKMVCSLAKIRCMSTPLGMDWDNRQRGATRAVVDSKTGRLVTMMTGNLVGSGDSRKNQEYQMEPAYEVLTQLADQQLIISASADVPSYDCDQGKISFRPTLMFQTRVFKFPLRNNGKVPLVFRLYFEDQGRPVALDDGHLPFVVEPTHGTVEAGESAIVCVRFSPMDVDEYEYVLRCVMPGIAPSVAERFAIPVSGSSLRPICHFELPESDYLMGRRTTDSNMPQFDEATRVIEFETCGVSSKTTKRFYIINPTDFNYDFEWKCVDGPQSTDVFRCTTEKGLVQSGKKFEIVFEFTPEAIETKVWLLWSGTWVSTSREHFSALMRIRQESLWKFCIPSQNIEVQFLLVGFTSEPNVFFDRTGVNFKSVLVGRQLKEVVKIKNTENMPFAFSFDGASNGEVRAKCDSALQFNPSTGIVPALGETAVTVTFQPPTERSYNYNATCFVRKKPGALVLNIKGEGYEIQEKIVSELADSSQFELVASPGVDNVLDFGMLQVNERKSKRVVISNHGKVAFDFRWTPDVKTNGLLSIHPEFGSVGKEERVVCELVFLPSAPMQLKPARMQCAITNGRTYHVSVYGTGRKPPLRLSQTEHDFGPHFLVGCDVCRAMCV